MKEQIKKYNNGSMSAKFNIGQRNSCFYRNPRDNNRCAVGCFIPDGHSGLKHDGGVMYLLKDNEDLLKLMPLEVNALEIFQNVHDSQNRETKNMHEILFNWIDLNVLD